MKQKQVTWIFLCCLTLLTSRVAVGQLNPSNGLPILYEVDRMEEKYVLCISYASAEKDKTSSYVVMGDTFSVQPHGAMCWVVMTNACILRTTFGPSSSNEVTQIKMRMAVYKIPFPKHTKLVFNSSVVELSKVRVETHGEANARVYEGEDALHQLKKMGVKPPDDMDVDKAIGH